MNNEHANKWFSFGFVIISRFFYLGLINRNFDTNNYFDYLSVH